MSRPRPGVGTYIVGRKEQPGRPPLQQLPLTAEQLAERERKSRNAKQRFNKKGKP